MASETLLPSNRTAFEEAADLTGARAGALPVPLTDLYRPFEIGAAHLPWLAWGLSVDLWSDAWDAEKRRVRVARSLPFHAIKGTETAIAEALAVVGATARRFVVPPANTFPSRSMTKDERAAFLDRFAQLRVYPLVERGTTGITRSFLAGPDDPGTAFPTAPAIKGTQFLRIATLHDRGEERTLTLRTITPETVGGGEAIAFDEVVLAARPTAAIHPGAPPKSRLFLVDDVGVRARIVRIPRATNYAYRLGREQYTTHMPRAELIDVRPQMIAEPHDAQLGSRFAGGGGQRIAGAFLPPSIAWRYLYERWHIHDPARAAQLRGASTFVGATRLGMPAYHAEVLTRIRGRRFKRTAGGFVNGHLVAASRAPVDTARAAVRVAQALRDTIVLDTRTWRLPRAGDRRPFGATAIGQYIEV